MCVSLTNVLCFSERGMCRIHRQAVTFCDVHDSPACRNRCPCALCPCSHACTCTRLCTLARARMAIHLLREKTEADTVLFCNSVCYSVTAMDRIRVSCINHTFTEPVRNRPFIVWTNGFRRSDIDHCTIPQIAWIHIGRCYGE